MKEAIHDGAAVKTGNAKQNKNRTWGRTYLIGRLSTIDPLDRRPVIPNPSVSPATSGAVVLALFANYLCCRTTSRNAAATARNRIGTRIMTTFDQRQEGFEKKFALDEEQKFKAEARRNKLLGLWAAEQLGKSGDEAAAYAKEVVAADFEEAGDKDVLRKVATDLAGKGVTEQQVRAKMDQLMAEAIAQVKAGI